MTSSDRPLNVLVLDSGLPTTLCSGKSVRLLNVFKRLGRQHRLHYISIIDGRDAPSRTIHAGEVSRARQGPEEHDVPAWLQGIVSSVRLLPRQQQTEFVPGRMANWVMGQPYFYAPWRHPGDYQRLSTELQRIIRHEAIDLVHCFDEEAAQYLPPKLDCPWISDPADAMALHARRRAEHAATVAERLHWNLAALRLQRYEQQLMARASATVYVSPVDAAVYGRLPGADRIRVIPNGVDIDYFLPSAAFDRPPLPGPRVLLTGHMSFAPNHHAAVILIDRLLPRIRETVPNVVCDLVGADPRPDLLARHDGERINVTGWVPDLRPWMAAATVYACPMVLGAGIKNKLLEAMAMAKAIVTTSRGADGVEVRDGRHVVVSEDEAPFADRVIELLRDPARGEALGRAARELAVERYSWDATARAYLDLYRQLLNASPTARDPAMVLRKRGHRR